MGIKATPAASTLALRNDKESLYARVDSLIAIDMCDMVLGYSDGAYTSEQMIAATRRALSMHRKLTHSVKWLDSFGILNDD